MPDVDVLVAGGGPVGLASAIEARLAGLSVAIVEPRSGVIDKACGEGLMPGTVAELARWGVHPSGCRIAGFAYLQGVRRAEYRFAGGGGLGVRRLELHGALSARAAELGVERVAGRVDGVVQSATTIAAGGVSARWLLACDGLHSTVRRQLGLEREPGRRRRFGLRRHFAVEPWTDLVEVHWSEAAEAYVTPVGEGTVGVAVLAPPGLGFDAALVGFPELAARLSGAVAASSLRGAGPLRQRTRGRVRGRALLVGDASGYVDALTGEGLRVGFAQARAAVAAIAGGEPQGYEREWRRVTRDARLITQGLLAAAQSPARRAIVPAARALPGVFGFAVERLAR
nr:FAD-dependent monooxygenase [Compostimonas suwonensis]